MRSPISNTIGSAVTDLAWSHSDATPVLPARNQIESNRALKHADSQARKPVRVRSGIRNTGDSISGERHQSRHRRERKSKREDRSVHARRRAGSPEFKDIQYPAPVHNQVRFKAKAIGLNRAETIWRASSAGNDYLIAPAMMRKNNLEKPLDRGEKNQLRPSLN